MFKIGSKVENPIIPFRVREKMIGFSAFCSCPSRKGAKSPKIGYFNHNAILNEKLMLLIRLAYFHGFRINAVA